MRTRRDELLPVNLEYLAAWLKEGSGSIIIKASCTYCPPINRPRAAVVSRILPSDSVTQMLHHHRDATA